MDKGPGDSTGDGTSPGTDGPFRPTPGYKDAYTKFREAQVRSGEESTRKSKIRAENIQDLFDDKSILNTKRRWDNYYNNMFGTFIALTVGYLVYIRLSQLRLTKEESDLIDMYSKEIVRQKNLMKNESYTPSPNSES